MKTHTSNAIRRNHNEGGFTLLEVIIAISIFMVGLLAIGSLQTRAVLSNSKSRDITEAVGIAMRTAEQLMSEEWDPANNKPVNLAASEYEIPSTDDFARDRFVVKITPLPPDPFTTGYPANTAVKIRIRVEWPRSQADASKRKFVTYEIFRAESI